MSSPMSCMRIPSSCSNQPSCPHLAPYYWWPGEQFVPQREDTVPTTSSCPSQTSVIRYLPGPQLSLLIFWPICLPYWENMKVTILSTWDIWVRHERPLRPVPCVRGESSSKYTGCLSFRWEAEEGSAGPTLTVRGHSQPGIVPRF